MPLEPRQANALIAGGVGRAVLALALVSLALHHRYGVVQQAPSDTTRRTGQPGPEVRAGEPLPQDEDHMATRNDTNDHNKAEQNRAADEAARTARTVTDETARVGEQTARAGADVFRRSTETARDTLQSGLNTASEPVLWGRTADSEPFQRLTDQVTQVLGFNGPRSEELARRSSQNLQAVS